MKKYTFMYNKIIYCYYILFYDLAMIIAKSLLLYTILYNEKYTFMLKEIFVVIIYISSHIMTNNFIYIYIVSYNKKYTFMLKEIFIVII